MKYCVPNATDKNMLLKDLDKWQLEVLDTKGNIVLRSGRQSGKSTVISVLAGEFAAHHKNKTVLVVASVERQAHELFTKILAYMEEHYKSWIRKGLKRPTKSKMELNNGTKILCLPTGLSGSGIRGYTVDLLIVDEAAFIDDAVFNSISPMIATRIKEGARMVLLSTPFGKENYFFRCFQDPSFTKFHISSEDCERIDKGFLEREKERMTKISYAQEYLGEFAEGQMQFFADELIKSVMLLKRLDTPPNQNGSYYMGNDLARMGEDQSTFSILELKQDILYQRDQQETSKTLLNETTQKIIDLDTKWNFKKILIDSEGLGIAVYDWLLASDQTKRKTIGVKNSTKIEDKDYNKPRSILKEELYHNLLSLMQRKEIQLLDDPEIFYALKSILFEYTKDTLGRTHLKIWGKSTAGGKRDHIAEGLIRAALAIKYKSLNMWLSSFRP